ncbi:MAG: GDSL-type esterase/lipase family protein [Oculatellaceae cyanobacterium Prado106]|jgi:lysophospholipase L1-like esterase|nr:GDSL-type esterase/lipase family protein [Oculatellaceae cyanobacterium Prado106]
MSSLCLVAASLVNHGQAPGWKLNTPPARTLWFIPTGSDRSVHKLCKSDPQSARAKAVVAEAAAFRPEFSQRGRNSASLDTFTQKPSRPVTGGQLYRQRLASLRMGLTYTRIAPDSFQDAWANTIEQPTHEQWKKLLEREATMMAAGQGNNRLTVIVGDSHALWFPLEQLSRDRFWLNQGISGDSTAGVLERINTFAQTRPDTIHVMVGINDLRQGKTDPEILVNVQKIMVQLRRNHPTAQVFVHSILPTRLPAIPSNRIRWLNYNIASLAKQEGVNFLNLQPAFADANGNLRRTLTTDGIHLNARGYQVWQTASSPIL